MTGVQDKTSGDSAVRKDAGKIGGQGRSTPASPSENPLLVDPKKMAVDMTHSERASSLVASDRLIADHRAIVSRPLQSLMSRQFSSLFQCNPNLDVASETCWSNGRLAEIHLRASLRRAQPLATLLFSGGLAFSCNV